MVYTAPKICEELWEVQRLLTVIQNQRIDNEEMARNLRYKRLKELTCQTILEVRSG